MSQVSYIDESDRRSFKVFLIFLRILAAAAILFVLFILYAIFLDSPIYMRVSEHRAVKTIKAADTVYINAKDKRTKVSDEDFKALQSIFKTAECNADGRGVSWGCGFTDDFSIEFVDTDTGKSVYIDKAMDGDGWYTIDYNGYDLPNHDDYDKVEEITKKYGMGTSWY